MKKKMLLAASLVLISGGLSACGNKGEKSTGTVKNAVHRNAESREDKAVNKALDAFSALKGAKIQDTVHVKTVESGQTKNVEMDMGVEYHADPFGSKASVTTVVNSEVSHSSVMGHVPAAFERLCARQDIPQNAAWSNRI